MMSMEPVLHCQCYNYDTHVKSLLKNNQESLNVCCLKLNKNVLLQVKRKKGSMEGAKERDGGDDSLRAVILEEAVIVRYINLLL